MVKNTIFNGRSSVALMVLLSCTSSDPESNLGSVAQAVSVSCSGVPGYTLRTYNGGDRVTNRGSLYECKPWPYSGWCGAGSAYEPGVGSAWPDAWTLMGTCATSDGGAGGTAGSGGTGGSGGTAGTAGTSGSGGTGGTGGSGGTAGYSCPTSTCKAPSCACASPSIPGSLTRDNTPQMILVTFDDALHDQSASLEDRMLNGGHRNPNGCEIPATFYVSTQYTNFHRVQMNRARGHEIAIHTMTHTTGTDTSLTTWQQEITGARQAVSDLAGIPVADMVGFRAPFLATNDAEFQALKNAGFLYESSLGERLGRLSLSLSSFIWPYTFDYLGAQVCDAGLCPAKPYPGLFEVPMWDWYAADGSLWAGMDPSGTYAQLTELFQRTFNQRYQGNRAPMGLFIHPAWASQDEQVRAFNDFAEWALGHANTWFVTNRQLVEWMKSPQPASAMANFPPMRCPTHSSGTETCDGWDNNANGQVDEGLTRSCTYSQGSFDTCASRCPATYPWPPYQGFGGSGGGGGSGGSGGSGTCSVAAWSTTTIYIGGQRASKNGNVYEACYWTQGNDPTGSPTSCQGQFWKLIGPC